MKKLLIFLCVILSSCSCLLSQIPPQKIYAGAGCAAPIPDYKLKVTASDNCEIVSFTQTPAAGTMLTASNKVATVILKATDASGNFKQISFTVTLLDTVKPVFTIDPSLLAYQVQQIDELYDFGDKLIAEQEKNLMQQSWLDSLPDLKKQLGDSTYYKKTLLTWTTKGHAVTGKGGRSWTFLNEGDSLVFLPAFYKP